METNNTDAWLEEYESRAYLIGAWAFGILLAAAGVVLGLGSLVFEGMGAFFADHAFAVRVAPIGAMAIVLALTWNVDDHEREWPAISFLVAAFAFYIVASYLAIQSMGLDLDIPTWIVLGAPVFALGLWIIDVVFGDSPLHEALALGLAYIGFFVAAYLGSHIGIAFSWAGVGLITAFILVTSLYSDESDEPDEPGRYSLSRLWSLFTEWIRPDDFD